MVILTTNIVKFTSISKDNELVQNSRKSKRPPKVEEKVMVVIYINIIKFYYYWRLPMIVNLIDPLFVVLMEANVFVYLLIFI